MTTRQMGQLDVDVRLTIGSLEVNTTAAQAAQVGSVLSAVESATFTWSRPHARLHEDAGQLDLVLRHQDPGQVALDDPVTLSVTGPTISGRLYLGTWWVESVDWQPIRVRGQRVWRYVVTATNAIGRAAATRLSALPWPAGQTLGQRVDAINAASPVGDLVFLRANSLLVGPANVAARDVDYADAGEIIQRTANTWGLVAIDGSDMVALEFADQGTSIDWPVRTASGPSLLRFRAPWPAVDVPSRAVVQAPRSLSRQGEVNRVAVTFWMDNLDEPDQDPEEATRVFLAPRTGRPTATLTINTESVVSTSEASPTDPQTVWLGGVMETAAAVVAEAGPPRPLLGQTRILLDRLEPEAASRLVHSYYRAVNTIELADAPADLDRFARVASGRVDISAGALVLDVVLVPLAPHGVRPLRWSDWPQPPDAPENPPMGQIVPLRFRDLNFTYLTASDLRLVDAPTAWRMI